MKFITRLKTIMIAMVLIVGLPGITQAGTVPPPPPFDTWLSELKGEAIAKGMNADIIGQALRGAQPIAQIIKYDRHQPEFSLTFWKYLSNAISDTRVKRGRELLVKHGPLLKRVAQKYGVQPRFLVAFWGLETNFGKYFGKLPIIGSLVTLAHDRRRAKFFRAQLLAALELMSKGDMPVDVAGSWAGAMGNFQFIPTSYRDFAIDGDGDGKRDLWNNLPDAFSSAANYLSRSGWDINRTWGREVKLPKRFDLSLISHDIQKPLKEWQSLGVRRADGRDLPVVAIEGSLVIPAGYKGPAFILYSNFDAIMTWNTSTFYAIAIGHLADRLKGGGGLITRPPANEVALTRDNVVEMQNLLTSSGFDTGGADGMSGPKTRKSIRAWQSSKSLPADGYPSIELLKLLRQ